MVVLRDERRHRLIPSNYLEVHQTNRWLHLSNVINADRHSTLQKIKYGPSPSGHMIELNTLARYGPSGPSRGSARSGPSSGR